ncbi:MAG: hypothetical protein AAGF31_05320 [Planctomycetota bacterium]
MVIDDAIYCLLQVGVDVSIRYLTNFLVAIDPRLDIVFCMLNRITPTRLLGKQLINHQYAKFLLAEELRVMAFQV